MSDTSAPWSHIEITGGIISGPSRRECAGSVLIDFMHIGRHIFFVDAVSPDDSRIGLFDSFEYERAIIEAEEAAAEAGCPVRDLVVEPGGRARE